MLLAKFQSVSSIYVNFIGFTTFTGSYIVLCDQKISTSHPDE